jgi:hypothetical protein
VVIGVGVNVNMRAVENIVDVHVYRVG